MMLRGTDRSHAVTRERVRGERNAGVVAAFRRLLLMVVCGSLPLMAGCPYYAVPPPGTVITTPASFNRSFSAAAGAMQDEGLAITVQDPGSGTIVGGIDGGVVQASVRQQADGSVVVQFDSKNARDPSLLDRISRSYDRRMGR
ncbi:hypothetical protein [Paraburkholderia sp. Tr-20389]|uniref:hypothetical protein n=1 Tax=Paraburkholderia sp. Tr-20389 TaxID=2703903 RepID=UPI001F11CBB1|nr:hypothetical protein [Paraburkholderia sp. Tr-20389]